MIIWMKKNVRVHMFDNGIVGPLTRLGFIDVHIAKVDGKFIVAVLGDVSGIGISIFGSPFVERVSVDNVFFEDNRHLFLSSEKFFEEYDNQKQKTSISA
jgi:hypothetical protein